MFLAKVQGHLVATVKDESLRGRKLVVVEPLKVDYDAAADGKDAAARSLQPTGRAIVAIDMLGAGEGQIVLITQGSSARMAENCNTTPTDAVIVGIVDSADIHGRDLI